MFPQQPTASAAIYRVHSLIDRVLDLRRQLGIDISLSICDSENMLPSLIEHELSMETPRHTSLAYDSRDWLVWSQSPREGKQLEKGQEKLRRCQ